MKSREDCKCLLCEGVKLERKRVLKVIQQHKEYCKKESYRDYDRESSIALMFLEKLEEEVKNGH